MKRAKLIVLAFFCLVFCFQSVIALSDVIIDNGEAGTSSTGTWKISSGVNAYGGNSLFANKAATYTYQYTITGSKDISLWWTWYNNRCSNIEVDIYDDNVLLNKVTINQSVQVQGGQWNLLGTYVFSTNVTVVINAPGICTTSIDALKIGGGTLAPVQNFTFMIN